MLTRRFGTRFDELFGLDLRSLASFRVVLAGLALAVLVHKGMTLEAFYTDQGVFPRELAMWYQRPWWIVPHLWGGNLCFQAALFLFAGVCAVLLLAGYRTRCVTFLLWFFMMGTNLRCIFVNNGGNRLLVLLLFWSLFLPLGTRYSLDSFLRRGRDGGPERVISAGTVALSLQVVFIYWFALLSKAVDESWWDGTALYMTLASEYFSTPIGQALYMHVHPDILRCLTHAVCLYELLGPVLLFLPVFTVQFRCLAILGFLVLQLGFGMCLELGVFPWASMVALIPFIPTKVWDQRSAEGFGRMVRRLLQSMQRAADRFLTRFVLRENLSSWFYIRPVQLRAGLVSQVLAALFLVCVFFANVAALTQKDVVPKKLRWLVDSFYLDQFWGVFVPAGMYRVWFVIPGVLRDGTQVDILRGDHPVSWDKPTLISDVIKNHHWRSYLINFVHEGYGDTLPYYLAPYLCRKWNETYKRERELLEVEIFSLFQEILTDHRYGVPTKSSFCRYACSGEYLPVSS